MIIHKGIRPVGELLRGKEIEDLPFKPYVGWWVEETETGWKQWSNRELWSGCKSPISKLVSRGNLIYCPICDEWFKSIQFCEEDI